VLDHAPIHNQWSTLVGCNESVLMSKEFNIVWMKLISVCPSKELERTFIIATKLIPIAIFWIDSRILSISKCEKICFVCALREEILPHVQTELPVLQFVPIAPCSVTGHH